MLIATGKAGKIQNEGTLKQAIFEVCEHLAEAIVRDGEGAEKLITIRVHGGKTRAVCRQVAETMAHIAVGQNGPSRRRRQCRAFFNGDRQRR